VAASSHVVLDYLRSFLSRQRGAEDDCELLRRFTQTRDGDAFALLMRRHGPMVLGLARRVVGDGQTAEDVFQAAFLMLARKAHTIRRPESLPCWLHGVAFRLALRASRSRQRRQERETHVRRSPPPTPLDELTARELLDVLDEELQTLPEGYRAPLILCCLEGLSQEEAAKRLGCSAGAVKGRLERGRNRLRLRLQKRGLTLPAVLGGTLLVTDAVSAAPPMLIHATLTAVKTGAGATPAATLLMQGAMRTMFLHKLKLVSVAVVLLGITGGGLGMMGLRPQAASKNESPAVAASDDKPMSSDKRVDLYGDPLPDGAVMRLGTLRRRAVGAKLAVTADGKSIVSVRGGKYLRIWDAASGKLREKRELPGSYGDDSVFSSDGRRLLTGLSTGEDRLKLWDVQTGNLLRTLVLEGAGSIWSAAFSPDGKAVAATGSAGKEHHIRVWELATGKVVFRKDAHGGMWIRRLLFTPDSKRLLAVIGADPPYLACWDLDSGRRLWDVNNFDPYTMVCTPGGKLLSDKPQVLDLATGEIVKSEKMPAIKDSSILRMLLSPDGRTLFVSTFKEVIVWDRVHGKELRTLAGAGEQIAVWPDGKSLLTNNTGLQRWDVDSGKALFADTFAHGHTGAVGHLAWSADGRRLVSDSTELRPHTDGTLRVWDAVTGRPLHRQDERKTLRFVTANMATETGDEVVDLSPDGRWLLTNARGEASLKMWEADTGKEARTLKFPPPEQSEGPRQLFRARFGSVGARVVALLGSQSNFHIDGETPPAHKVVVWDATTGERLTCRPVGWTESEGSAIAPDGRTLVSSGALIDTASGKEMARLEGTGKYGTRINVAFSRDGALVAGESPVVTEENKVVYVSRDGVRVWETATGKMVAHVRMKPRTEQVFFHPDNRYVATNDVEGIRIWDVLTGKLAAHREMPEKVPATPRLGSFASCPTFAPDGRLATGHPDSTILVWDVPLPASKPRRLGAKELKALWTDLADGDAAKAWRAVWRMAEAPKDALSFLRDRVKPYPTAPSDVTRKLLADLDSDSFESREAAVKRLKELGLPAEPALRTSLKAKPSLEQRRRIEPLLAQLAETPQALSAVDLRQLRALIVLERIGSPEARRLLEDVAKGPESARLTRQARAALACLP
jgi:RNA polymerase sigma factor (sigma-70 family)